MMWFAEYAQGFKWKMSNNWHLHSTPCEHKTFAMLDAFSFSRDNAVYRSNSFKFERRSPEVKINFIFVVNNSFILDPPRINLSHILNVSSCKEAKASSAPIAVRVPPVKRGTPAKKQVGGNVLCVPQNGRTSKAPVSFLYERNTIANRNAISSNSNRKFWIYRIIFVCPRMQKPRELHSRWKTCHLFCFIDTLIC